MTAMSNRFAIVALAAAIASTACARPRASEPAPADHAELEAIYRARLDSAKMRFTAADVRFMTDMIAHHAQALVMSRLAQTNGASPPVQTLAGRIINAQNDEIATMRRWLRDRGQPVPEVHSDATSTMAHGAEHGTLMPGMLTDAQLQELQQARNRKFDELFLRYMIQHHRGAVVMVRDLFATDGAGQDEAVFKFASDAQVDQSTEIARMELMLAELGASP